MNFRNVIAVAMASPDDTVTVNLIASAMRTDLLGVFDIDATYDPAAMINALVLVAGATSRTRVRWGLCLRGYSCSQDSTCQSAARYDRNIR